jgi:radical SAM protein with 4Fe4S-binding SPASM domain
VVETTGFAQFSPCASILDVTPDGDVIYCLPLAQGFRARYTDYPDYETCRRAFADFYAERRVQGFKEECHDCVHLSRCKGSCISRTLSTAELQP